MANHQNLQYRGGQGPILHLELDLQEVLTWATRTGRRWAMTFQNASTSYATFSRNPDDLARLDWDIIDARDFRAPAVKEHKQAEFLVYDMVPWSLVRRIGAQNSATLEHATRACVGAQHRPKLELTPSWYF